MQGIPKEHRISTQLFLDTGIFTISKSTEQLTRQNPTLTGRGFHCSSKNSEFHYSIPTNVLPFIGWDYKAIKKICHDDSITAMYSIYLTQILHKSAEKMKRNQFKFHFILADALDMEAFLPVDFSYDRITTSNMWDVCPLLCY